MAISTTPYYSCTSKVFDVDKTQQYELTIQLALGGFSFVIQDGKDHQILLVENHQSDELNDDTTLFTTLEKTLNEKGLQEKPFHSVRCIIESRTNTLIPASLFDPDEAETYLGFCHPKTSNARFMADKLRHLDTYNVFSISKTLVDLVEKRWQNVSFMHQTSILLEALATRQNEDNQESKVYLFVKNRNFDMAVFQGKRLTFFNNFKFNTKDDFAYFLLLAMGQCGLNTDETPVYFSGMIMAQSEIINLCERYVRNIRFIKDEYNILFESVFSKIPYYQYFVLFNALTCEL